LPFRQINRGFFKNEHDIMQQTSTHGSQGIATSAPESPRYPSNRTGWLHTLTGILTRTEAAREIGIEAMLLILAIAVQEDSQQYGVPPTLFFGELQRILGIRSRARLERARQKAIDAGWLVFIPGPRGDLAAARYWTVIPERLNLFESVPQAATLSPEQAGDRRGDPACLDERQLERSTCPTIAEVQPPNSPPVADAPPVKSAPAEDSSPSVAAPITPGVPVTGLSRPVLPEHAEPESKITAPSKAARNPGSKFQFYDSIPMNPTTRAQALTLYLAYPRHADSETESTDATSDLQAIHRALAKITFAELLPILKRFADLHSRPGHDPKLTPPLVTWFDQEHWQQR